MRLAPLVITGPTASGKTAAALALAQALPVRCEIISMDSALVYRGMDIGTAKPSAQELAAVPHHLINIRDPLLAYSAAEFVRDARALIAAIHARGKLPLLVGGTMLYFKALAQGLDDMPAANPALRETLAAEAAALGWPALHAQLAQVDPRSAERLAPNDSQRIQRALEVYRSTGLPLSHFQRQAQSTAPADPAAAGRYALLSLEPQDRAWLHARIAQRMDAMLQGGLIEEVQRLRQRGDLHPDLPSMRCVGYRQVWQALDAHWPATQLREQAIAATRQLAKRQITWLRSLPQRHAIACEQPDASAQVLQKVSQLLQNIAA